MKIKLLELIRYIFRYAFYPIIYLLRAIYFRRSKSSEGHNDARVEDGSLYFSNNIPGTGTIKCNRCDFSQEIVGVQHGYENNPWSKTGAQCQHCGKFHINRSDNVNAKDKCECGGNVEREKALFCPKCKTYDMHYSLRYMT